MLRVVVRATDADFERYQTWQRKYKPTTHGLATMRVGNKSNMVTIESNYMIFNQVAQVTTSELTSVNCYSRANTFMDSTGAVAILTPTGFKILQAMWHFRCTQ